MTRARCCGAARWDSCFRPFTSCPISPWSKTSRCRSSCCGVAEPERARAHRADARGGRHGGAGAPPIRASCRAARCSGSRSRAPWCTGRGWCSRTSRPETSTRAPPRRPCAAAQPDQSECRRRDSDHPLARGRRHRRPHPGARWAGAQRLGVGRVRARRAGRRPADRLARPAAVAAARTAGAARQSRCSRSRSASRSARRSIWSTPPR